MSTCCGGESKNGHEIKPCVIDHSGCAVRSSWGLLGGYNAFPFGTFSLKGKLETQPRAGEPTRHNCDGDDCFDRGGCYAIAAY